MSDTLKSREIGPITILFGNENGKYPHGNSLVVKGQDKSVIIDPSLGIVARSCALPQVDMILLSHVHEDHVAGVHLFPQAEIYAHEEDAIGMESLDGILGIYGFKGALREEFKQTLRNEFYYQPRPDVQRFNKGDQFDLGGVTISVLHTPGHTRGHCCFVIEWQGNTEKFVYLGDIELTGFGPYYGDAWSSLDDFEQTLHDLKSFEAKWWLTFHHKGLIESREAFLPMLAAFTQMISFREGRLLDYISEPRSMTEIVKHRFVYRPGAHDMMIDQVELRSMSLHLERLIGQGEVVLLENKYHRVVDQREAQ